MQGDRAEPHVMLVLVLIAALSSADSLASTPTVLAPAVQIFQDACIDGAARLIQPRRIEGSQLSASGRTALSRAARIDHSTDPALAKIKIRDLGVIYVASDQPLTYLVPQLSADSSQSSAPVCVVLTRAEVFQEAKRKLRSLTDPEAAAAPLDKSNIGESGKYGTIIAEVFESRFGNLSVALFEESGWTVMRVLDFGDRRLPYELPRLEKKKN